MKHFTISEMIKSDTALKHALWNGATKEAEENLKALIESILDPLRELYGRPIHVTSGYRCPKLNRLVGGAPNSQHMRGEASDIVAMSKSTRDCGALPAMTFSGGYLSKGAGDCGSLPAMTAWGGGSSKGSIAPNDPSAPLSRHGGEASAIPQAARGQSITISPEENKKLGQLIEALGLFDQLIYEQCDQHGNPRWIHVSWKRNGWNRKQVLYK